MKDSLELIVRTIPLFITTSQNYSYFLPSQSRIRWVDENVAPPTETFSSVTLNITYTTAGNVRIDVNWGNGGFSLNFQVLYSYFSSLQSRFKGNENVLPPSEPFELHLCSTCVSLDETKKTATAWTFPLSALALGSPWHMIARVVAVFDPLTQTFRSIKLAMK